MITKRKITDYIGIVANTAQTSHYELSFDGLSEGLRRFLGSKNVDRAFVLRNAGLLCSSASLPGSQLATTETRGNFMGVIEPMVHSSCLLYTSPSPRDVEESRMPSSA